MINKIFANWSGARKLIFQITLLVFAILTSTQQSFAEGSRCKCDFAQKPWEAYGTRAACSAVTTNGKTSCNISFGGTGADPKLITQILVQNPKEYERKVNATLIKYLNASQENDQRTLTHAEFISTALPIFMRGAYLREGVHKNLKGLDTAVLSFTKKQASQISDVFRGEKPPFKSKELNAEFSVEKGVVTADYEGIRIITVFLQAPES